MVAACAVYTAQSCRQRHDSIGVALTVSRGWQRRHACGGGHVSVLHVGSIEAGHRHLPTAAVADRPPAAGSAMDMQFSGQPGLV